MKLSQLMKQKHLFNRLTKLLFTVILVFVSLLTTKFVNAQTCSCTLSKHPFARGYCSLSRGRHGQWVRASANLLKNGNVQVRMGLETDTNLFGIGGSMRFELLDSTGKVLGSGSSTAATIPAKGPDTHFKFRQWDSPWTEKRIDPKIIPLVKSIKVYTIVQNDNAPLPWGIKSWSVSTSFNL